MVQCSSVDTLCPYMYAYMDILYYYSIPLALKLNDIAQSHLQDYNSKLCRVKLYIIYMYIYIYIYIPWFPLLIPNTCPQFMVLYWYLQVDYFDESV